MLDRIQALVQDDPDLASRLVELAKFSKNVRASEYHLTNACNIRCSGCWFFEYDFDRRSKEVKDLGAWREFVRRERERGITAALLIGGEPTLFPERISAFIDEMPFVTISSNGLEKLPMDGFENVTVALTFFGGGRLDDQLRGIRPNGRTFDGLIDTALAHYRGDPRVQIIFAISHDGIPYIEETVKKVRDNGNRLTFNYYSGYGSEDPLRAERESAELLEEALRVHDAYSDTVVCHPYYIRALVTGETEFGRFGYDVCPSISEDHPRHRERRQNGNPTLPMFNAVAPDLETVNFCCTSGHCDGCRDSQAVYSWLMVSVRHFLESKERLQTWADLAESYWRQFVWSPYRNDDSAQC